MSIAYNARERSAPPIIDLVSELRSLPPVEIVVTSVNLVYLRREGRV